VDCVFVCSVSGVVHQARVFRRTGIAWTRCGMRIVIPHPGLRTDADGPDCSHCGSREAPWEKWGRHVKRQIGDRV